MIKFLIVWLIIGLLSLLFGLKFRKESLNWKEFIRGCLLIIFIWPLFWLHVLRIVLETLDKKYNK